MIKSLSLKALDISAVSHVFVFLCAIRLQSCLRSLGVIMSQERIITVILIVGVAIFVQYNGYQRHIAPKRWIFAWKNLYKEVKTWTERMVNVDKMQLKEKEESGEGCYILHGRINRFCFGKLYTAV